MPLPAIFLPGILMPAAPRYEPLSSALGDGVRALAKDLEVYAQATVPPDGYSLDAEIAGIERAADAAGFDRFHLYGHSGGGAVALAFTARHADRVISLALDEPACDFSPEALDEIRSEFLPMLELPTSEMMGAFVAKQLRAGVLPSPPSEPPPPWMATRPAGIRAFVRGLATSSVDVSRIAEYSGPVYYSHGSFSSESWVRMRDRLSRRFHDFTSEEYVGASHMQTSHVREPERVAAALRKLWAKSESGNQR